MDLGRFNFRESLIVGTVVLLLLFLFVWKVPKWQVANIPDEKDRLATEAGFRQTFVQIVGGRPFSAGSISLRRRYGLPKKLFGLTKKL